jgi:hypothetical protein
MSRLEISRENPVESSIRSAWWRSVFVRAFEQLAFALAVVFGGGILMLLLGTQILNWYWLMLLAVTAFAVSVTRMRSCMLTRYRVAQLVDRRLELRDSLSTALFLLTEANRRNDPVARFQIDQAKEIAASVNAASAFPFRTQRSWVMTGSLAIVMFGLFATRYFVHNQLSFAESLIPIHLGSVLEGLEQSLSAENEKPADPGAAAGETRRATQSERKDENGEFSRLQDSNLGQQRDPATSAQSAVRNKAVEENRTAQNEKSENALGNESDERRAGDNASRENREQAHNPAPANTDQDTPGTQPSSSGLLEKMKDAVSSLLAKMNSTGTASKPAQNGERSPEGSRTEQDSSAKWGQQQQSPNARAERARSDPSSAGGEQGQTREKAEMSQGRNSDQAPDNKGSDAHSGIGSQNGDKELKEAEQLQAMGKLAEIIGKRSADLTGEVTVETYSGKQRLKTQDSQRVGQHSDSGGEINRDEIPLMYQQYVREYMERVHKEAKSNE